MMCWGEWYGQRRVHAGDLAFTNACIKKREEGRDGALGGEGGGGTHLLLALGGGGKEHSIPKRPSGTVVIFFGIFYFELA